MTTETPMSTAARPNGSRRARHASWLSLGLSFLTLGLAATAATAATITVNNAADYNFGSGPSNADGLGCTLRKAIANANNNAQTFSACAAGSGDSNTIVFSGAGNIKLGSYGSPFYINRNLTIQGPVLIDGDNQGDIFRVASGGITLTLDGTTLTKGSNSAVMILSSTSRLQATGCAFVDNSNSGSGGGAITSYGRIDITACSFTGNAANGSNDGGGAIQLSSSDPSTITASSFINNTAKTKGGAISFSSSGNLAALLITVSNFMNNSAKAEGGQNEGGGAIFHQQGLLTVVESLFAHNTVESAQGRGGALYLAVGSPTAVLEHNLFTLNEVKGNQGMGGAIFAARAALANGNSFISNSASTNGRGGAIASTVKVKGGFNLDFPGFMLSNSTLYDNSAQLGGAIYNMGPESGSVERGITLLNVTLDGNRASQANGGGGIYSAEVQAGRAPETDVRNTILSNNTANGVADNCNSNAGIALDNNGGNLLWPAASCANTVFSAADVGDPKLGLPLPNVPPPVLVMEPQAGSFALQHGLPSVCSSFPVLNLDQRLFPRPNPGNTPCDSGAFESDLGPPAPALSISPAAGLAFGQVPVGQTVQLQATVSNPGSLPLQGLSISQTGARFSIQSNTCGASLAANTSCTLQIAYAPTAAQNDSGQLSASGAGGLSAAISLGGSGFVATPGLNITPDAGLAFGNQTVGGTSAFQLATLTNTGNVGLSGLNFSVPAPFALVAGGTCGSSLAMGASCTQRVVFSPTAPGPVNANLVATSSQGPNDAIVLSGFGSTPPNLVLTPAEGLAFGRVPLGTQSGLKQALLSNTGTTTAALLAFNFVSGSNGFAVAGHNCPNDLPGGQSCLIDLRFTPASSNPVTAQFRVHASIFTHISNVIDLSGQGFSPARIEIVPGGRDFGEVETGTNSGPQALSVRSVGGEAFELVELIVGAPFQIDSSCNLPAVIIPGASCAVMVSVTPSVDGAVSSQLTARALAPAADPLQTVEISHQVPLRAVGFTPGDLVVQPAAGLHFGPVAVGQTSAAQTATLFNSGSQPLSSLGFFAPSPFQIESHTCGSGLSGGSSCTLQIRFAPVVVGTPAANFTASAVTQGGPVVFRSIGMSGSGFQPSPSLDLQPAGGLGFGTVLVGSQSGIQTATLLNSGSASANISLSLGGGAGFQITGGSCGATLAAGSSCTVQLRFAPASEGAVVGSLIASAAGLSEQIALRGVGLNPAEPAFASIPAIPGPLRFAARPGETDSRTVQVSNPGTGTLQVGNPQLSGAQAGDFLVLSPLPIELSSPTATANLVVSCTPTGAGQRTALLSLQTTDPQHPSIGFALVCEGLVPSFADGFERDPADL